MISRRTALGLLGTSAFAASTGRAFALDYPTRPVKFVVGIAGAGEDHLPLLGKIAQVFADEEKVAELEVARTVEDVQGILGQVGTPASHT